VKLKRPNPPKLENVLETARDCIESGKYLATFHSECRQFERDITLLDALHVIRHGFREPKHDQYKEEWQSWNYAIRGTTLQDETVRVVISFDKVLKLLIVTVINIVRRE
jgi:hypothetical protein